jgi:hypothetical protein
VSWLALKRGGVNRFSPDLKISIVSTPEVSSADPGAVGWARQLLGFEPDPKQQEVLSANTRRGILNCTRQWGKSTTCAIKAVHYAQFHPDSLVVVASPSLRQSGEFLRKAKKAVNRARFPRARRWRK